VSIIDSETFFRKKAKHKVVEMLVQYRRDRKDWRGDFEWRRRKDEPVIDLYHFRKIKIGQNHKKKNELPKNELNL